MEDSDNTQGIASLEYNQVVFPYGVKPKIMLGQFFATVTEVRHLRQCLDLVTNVLLQSISGLRMMASHIAVLGGGLVNNPKAFENEMAEMISRQGKWPQVQKASGNLCRFASRSETLKPANLRAENRLAMLRFIMICEFMR